MAAQRTNGSKPAQRAGRPEKTTKVVEVPKPQLEPAQNTMEIEVPVEDELLTFSTDKDLAWLKNPEFAERERVFQIDEVWYDAPVLVPAGLGLQFLRMKLRMGADWATMWALEVAIGTEAIDKLTEIPDMHAQQLDAIIKKVTQKFVDATTVPKGE